MTAWNRPRWLLAVLVVVTAISMSGAQQLQSTPYFVECYTTTSIDFVRVPNEAPLGSYDFQLALFPGLTPAGAAPIQSGLQCSALCRRSGRPLSGLTRNLDEPGTYSCYCGVAWRGFPEATSRNLTGAMCGQCASDNSSQCPANDVSMAIYYHRPVYDPVTIQYQECHEFSLPIQRRITAAEQGLEASVIFGSLLETVQASTCIAECSLHGFSLSGVGNARECWCFNQFDTGFTFTCSQSACLVVTDQTIRADVFDQLLCGGADQIAVYGTVAHRAPTVRTVPVDGSVLSRTVGDVTDMFQCYSEINSIYMPLLTVWTLGGNMGTNLTSPRLQTLTASSNVSTVSEGGYEGGIFSYTCVVRLPSDSSGSFPFVLSTITVNVFTVPTATIIESGIPIASSDPSVMFAIQCANGGNGTAINFRWSNGTSTTASDTLTFVSPTVQNEGNYTCHFTIEETGRNATQVHVVRIYETPLVNLPSQLVSAIGDQLRCSEYVTNIGDRGDVLVYSWTTPQGPVTGDVVDTTLSGTYECTATNSVLDTAGAGMLARGSNTVWVIAVPPPLANISITGGNSSVVHRDSRDSARYVILPGESSVFNCTESTGAANVTYRWLRVVPGSAPEVVTTSTSFMLSNVGAPEDGQYQCEVTNPRIESSGRTTATTAIYDVFFAPEVMLTSEQYAIIDEPFSLLCTVSGDLPDQYAWSRLDGGAATLVTSNSTLSIASVARSSTGMYQCNVSGQAADTLPAYGSMATVQITAQAAPAASLSLSSPTSSETGATLEVTCTATGETPASADITWERNGDVLATAGRVTVTRTGDSLVLAIDSVLRGDAGEYTCRVVDASVGIPSRRTATSLLVIQTSGSDPQTDGSDSTPIIIGVVCGVVGLILLVVLVAIIYKQWQKKSKSNPGKDNPTYGEVNH